MSDIGSGTSTDDAVASYLATVRAALADLPASEVAEIIDDIGPHVAEVAEELADGSAGAPGGLRGRLDERLGEPRRYAAELRAAAGYPPRAEPAAAAATATDTLPRLSLWLLVAAIAVVLLGAPFNGYSGLFGGLFLGLALAAVSLLIAVRGRTPGTAGAGERQDGLHDFVRLPEVQWLRSRNPGGTVEEYARLLQPGWWLIRAGVVAMLLSVSVFGPVYGDLLVVALMVPLTIGSVWLGRRSRADRRWLWAVLPLNAFAFVMGAALWSSVPFGWFPVGYSEPSSVPTGPTFSNVYPYDSTGRPLTGVFLYDENGVPITAPYAPYSDCQPLGEIPTPANQFPQPEYTYGTNGECVPRTSGPNPPQLPSASVSPTGSPSASSPPSGSQDASATSVTTEPVATPTT